MGGGSQESLGAQKTSMGEVTELVMASCFLLNTKKHPTVLRLGKLWDAAYDTNVTHSIIVYLVEAAMQH